MSVIGNTSETTLLYDIATTEYEALDALRQQVNAAYEPNTLLPEYGLLNGRYYGLGAIIEAMTPLNDGGLNAEEEEKTAHACMQEIMRLIQTVQRDRERDLYAPTFITAELNVYIDYLNVLGTRYGWTEWPTI